MPIDPSISLQTQNPDLMNRISNLVNLKQSQLDLKKSQDTYAANVAQQQAESKTAQIAAQQAQFNLTGDQLQKLQNDFNSIAQDPTISAAANETDPNKLKEYSGKLIDMLRTHADFARQAGVPDPMVEQTLGTYMATAALHPERLQQLIAQRQQAGIGAGGQVAQTQVPVSAQQQLAGTSVAGQPVTALTTQFGQKKLAVTPTQQQGIQMAPALGQPEAVSGVLGPVTKDWADTQANAANASRNIGLLQNIKQYATGAVTGVANERRSYIAGLAGLLGMSEDELKKTSTDLLAKNSNMLALAGGNTDAARALAESANPNVHMTPEAIHHAADQVISQQELALKKQQFLQGYVSKAANDPSDRGRAYTQALSQWNQVADPRILQLRNMSPQEKAQMKASMTPGERAAFGMKLRQAEKMGILQ